MSQFMWMEIFDPIPFFQLLKITGWSLRVHRIRTTFLGKYKLANTFGSLLCTEALQQFYYLRTNVNHPSLSIFGISKVDSSGFGILEIMLNGDSA